MNAAEQFANDYLLVVENDQDAWDDITQTARQANHAVAPLSDEIRWQWESLVNKIAEDVEEEYTGIAGLIIRQTLGTWGSAPFDIIATHVIARDLEINQ